MDTKHDSGTPKARRAQKDNGASEPIPEVDESVRREARAVGLVAVVFAAGISAQALYALGILIGISPWTAWMLPGAMDLYAFESTRVASRVPARHPSRAWAVWNARLALSFTVGGNALFHALHLASGHHGWTDTDIALTAVSAIPPVIVERFLHLQTKINSGVAAGGGGIAAPAAPVAASKPPGTSTVDAAQAAAAAARQQNSPDPAVPPALPPAPSGIPSTPAAVKTGTQGGSNVVAINGSGRRPVAEWAELALPHYRRHTERHGAAPTANDLVRMIRDAHPNLSVPKSDRAARNIRQATEILAEQPSAQPESEPDRDEKVA